MGLFNFPQVDSNVNVIFSVDGDEYAVEQFKIGFHQPVDNLKNQPEGEVRGGTNHDNPFADGEKQYLRMGCETVGEKERGSSVQDRNVRSDI